MRCKCPVCLRDALAKTETSIIACPFSMNACIFLKYELKDGQKCVFLTNIYFSRHLYFHHNLTYNLNIAETLRYLYSNVITVRSQDARFFSVFKIYSVSKINTF